MSTSSLSSFPLWLLDPPGRQRFNQSDSSGSSQTSPRASLPASSPVSPPPVSQSDLAGIVVSHQVHPSSVAPNWLAPQDTEKEFRYYSELSLRGHPFLVSSQRRRDINSPTHVQQAQQTPVWPRLGDHQPLPILQSEYTSSEKPKVLRPSPSRRTLLSEPARPKEIVKLEHHFNAPGFRLPVAEGSRHTSPLTERELMWLSRECFMRFLKVTDYDPTIASGRMERALIWRRTHRMDDVEYLDKELQKDIRTGRIVSFGFSSENWPIVYHFPNKNTLPWAEDRSLHCVRLSPARGGLTVQHFMVERSIDLMADGVTQMVPIFSFTGPKLRPGPTLPLHVMRDILTVFDEHYPELLGLSVVQEVPWWARLFVTLIWPFVGARTRRRVRFLGCGQTAKQPELRPEQLLTECGGELDLPWDYDSYWPVFMATIYERREEHLRRWRAIGPSRAGYEERLWKVALPTATHVSKRYGSRDDSSG